MNVFGTVQINPHKCGTTALEMHSAACNEAELCGEHGILHTRLLLMNSFRLENGFNILLELT